MTAEQRDWRAEVRRRLRDTPVAGERQGEIIEEVAQFLESRYEELVEDGVDAELAAKQVLAELEAGGGLDRNIRRVEIDAWDRLTPAGNEHRPVLESILMDCRYSIRTFVRRPAFTLVALTAMALGIASITAVFSLVNAVLLNGLPLSQDNRVVLVWQQDLTTGRDRMTLSSLEYQAYRGAKSFESVGAVRGVRLNVSVGDAATAVSAVQVSPELLETLGVAPLLGRSFALTAEPQTTHEALVTHEFWQRHMGADSGVLGTSLMVRAGFGTGPRGAQDLDGAYVVVGVLPPRVSLPYRAADIWIPLRMDQGAGANAVSGLITFGRLAQGATLASASAEMATIAQGLMEEFPQRSTNISTWLVSLREELVGDITPTLILLSASVALLSLIVSANIGNMLLSRLSERQRELSVRGALGASRARLLQQLLTESIMLGVTGGVVGVALSYWTARALALSGPVTIPGVDAVRLDAQALTVALLASVIMSVFFGLLPALRTLRPHSNQLAQRAGNTAEAGRLREFLTIAEFALAFVVLVGAGLVFSSSRAMEAAPVGYDPRSALTFRISLSQAQYTRADQRRAFFGELRERLGVLPGVTSVGAVNILPQMDTNASIEFDLDAASSNATAERPTARMRVATPGYFESLGIGVVRGRAFQDSDLAAGAIVVSRSMAQQFWPDADPVGRNIRLALSATPPAWLPVVGVVEDVRQWINSPPDPTLYWANAQQPEYAFVVRTMVDPTTIATSATAVVRELDPSQAVFDVHSMQERLDQSQQLTYERFRTTIMGAFGIAAFLLAGLGIYGVVRYSVVQRTQEFGIRVALGASPNQLFAMVLLQSLRSIAIGGVIGISGSIAMGRLLQSVLYGGATSQPLIIAVVSALLIGLATSAALGPARRAARVDPLVALRGD